MLLLGTKLFSVGVFGTNNTLAGHLVRHGVPVCSRGGTFGILIDQLWLLLSKFQRWYSFRPQNRSIVPPSPRRLIDDFVL